MSWRRIWLLSLVFAALLGVATWAVLHRSDAATAMVRRELQALFVPPLTVGSTTIDVARGRLTASDLRLADPSRPGAVLLAIDSASVDAGFGDLGAPVDVHAVTVDGFRLEGGPQLPTAAQLFAKRGSASGEPPRVPTVELRRGTVVATVRAGEPPVELADVALTLRPLEGEGGRLQVHGTATLTELGARLEWYGDVDPGTGAANVTLTSASTRVSTATLARVARLLGVEPPALELGAELRRVALTVDVPPRGTTAASAAATPQLQLSAELTGLHVRGANVPPLATAATLTLEASDRDDGVATVRVVQRTPRGALDVRAKASGLRTTPQLEVRAHGDDIEVDADVIAALRSFEVGADIVAALRPTTGRADLELYLRDPHRRGGTAELDLDLRDVTMAFHGFGSGADRPAFPLPLVQARGRVRLRDDVVMLDDLQASVAGGPGNGTVRLQGRVDTTQPSGEDTTIDIHGEDIAFSPDLRAALTTLLDDAGALYDKFAPVGRATVDVQLRPRRELRGGYAVEVRPKAASMQWAGFPYRLDPLDGAVRVDDDGASFDLVGRHGAGSLAMRGYIPLGGDAADGPGFSAVVQLDAIELDDDLGRAVAVIAPELEGAWLAAAPSGRISGQVKVWRHAADEPLCHDARLALAGVALRLPAAPWRAIDLQGHVLVQGLGDRTRVDFDALRGRLDHGSGPPASLAMLGNLVRGKTASEELVFVVRDLELDGTLGDTLHELGALGRDAWTSLQPSGRIDLVCRHERTGDRAEPLHVVVHLVDVRSDAAMLPRPAEHMTGELVVRGGEVRFADLRGLLGGAMVRCSDGRIHQRPDPDGRTELAFTVECKGMPIDDGVANLFSGPLKVAVLRRQLLGSADVDTLRLRFAIPREGSTLPFETNLSGQLRLYDLDMTLGEGSDSTLVTGITGVATLAESTVSDTGGQLSGALRGVSLQMFGQPFEAIDAAFVADAERIAVDSLTARCHGGALRSGSPGKGLEYLLPSPATPLGRLRADLAFERVDVYTFLDHGGWQNPPYSGSASGTIVLEALDGNNVIDAVGSGMLVIERADLGVVPLFTAIYAQLPPADRPRFDGLRVAYRVGGRRVELADLVVHSNLLNAEGKGRLDFDGYLDIQLSLNNLLGTSADPFVMPLIDELAKGIISFHLHGYLRDLRAERRWVTEGAPARRPVVPMPPALQKPAVPDF